LDLRALVSLTQYSGKPSRAEGTRSEQQTLKNLPFHPEVVPLPLHLKEVKKDINRGCTPQKAEEYVKGLDESLAIRIQLGRSGINLCQ